MRGESRIPSTLKQRLSYATTLHKPTCAGQPRAPITVTMCGVVLLGIRAEPHSGYVHGTTRNV
jgi:hypothetical protein